MLLVTKSHPFLSNSENLQDELNAIDRLDVFLAKITLYFVGANN